MRIGKKTRPKAEPVLDLSESESHLRERGESGSGSLPVRTCIVERTRKEKPTLLRFVISPDNEVVPDIKGNLPGRGVWVTSKKEVVAEAVRRHAFERAFRKPVSVNANLPGLVEELFKRSALERLSICTKAGLVVAGFSKVEAALNRGEIVGLLHAKDAAADGKAKLDRKFLASGLGKGPIGPKNLFSSAEISLATGGTNVIHAGVKEGGAARAFFEALDRLSGYCGGDLEDAPPARV
ncbi:MAG TPA: RNA-binding protein [Hyphomicrobiales bacterium]|nr:RNA-binding protein [Hyphomicrobiales bacterium]